MPTASPPLQRHALTFPIDVVEWRQAEGGRSSDYTLTGHAAVFNRMSEDLGGFREQLLPGAFRAALHANPDVRLLFGHNADTLIPLARTKSGTLDLREDATGLHVWAKVAPTAFANDMRVAMQRGDLDQMSFAFTIREGGDEWEIEDDSDTAIRTILPDGVEALYDVSVVTYPAYPQTDVAIRELRYAVESGRLPATVLGEPAHNEVSAPATVADEQPSRSLSAGDALKLARAKRTLARRAEQTPKKETG